MTKLSDDQVNAILNKSPSPDMEGDYDVSLEEIESFGDKESMLESFQEIARYNKMLREKITFMAAFATCAYSPQASV